MTRNTATMEMQASCQTIEELNIASSPALTSRSYRIRQYIQPSEFCSLAISHRRMTRRDFPEEGLCGLLDEESGTLFLTDRSQLLSL